MKTTTVALGAHFDAFIQASVLGGRYTNASEVIRAGLRRLEEDEQKIAVLRAAIEEGEASGYVEDFDFESHLEELKAKRKKNGISLNMNRIVLLLSFCLSVFLASCTKETMTAGYISVDGERRLDLQCGYEADMSGIGYGKNNWHLFAEDIEIKNQSDINQCSVSVWSAPREPVLTSIRLYGIPGYGNLMLEFSGSDSKEYEIKGQFAEQMGAGQGTHISGTAKVNTFSSNSSSTHLNLDVTLNLDKTIRIVFNGSTPNDGLAWMMD